MNSLILRARLLMARHRELAAVVREAQSDKPSDLPQFLAACQSERVAIEHGAAEI